MLEVVDDSKSIRVWATAAAFGLEKAVVVATSSGPD